MPYQATIASTKIKGQLIMRSPQRHHASAQIVVVLPAAGEKPESTQEHIRFPDSKEITIQD
ncbi:hypothetical protein [Tardiphaga sp.]|uniref:hypothetical protein n=1 Tax=Tardiphaga sp. TaxID=1926292 RepID=UPI0025F27D62|nr:hypothetical protein [Tardiphaga sp.]